MALQPFVGPWSLLQFRNLLYTVSRTPWTSDQPLARPLPKHRTIQTQNKRIHTPKFHALSWIRSYDPSVRASEDSSRLRERGHCDQLFLALTACKYILAVGFCWLANNITVYSAALPNFLMICDNGRFITELLREILCWKLSIVWDISVGEMAPDD
jgi:hypothetical protein